MNMQRMLCLGFMVLGALVLTVTTAAASQPPTVCGADAVESDLPLPDRSPIPTAAYEQLLYGFILERQYTEKNWCSDKRVRDTGPWIQDMYYGTHPAVRIFYSPKVMYWLTGDPDYWPEGKQSGQAVGKKPREGKVPDGGMIVKEMFQAPAARYTELGESEIVQTLYQSNSPGWTVMVKDSRGSHDGWLWGSVFKGIKPDGAPDDLSYPETGFGQSCINCHTVAENEFTFASTSNIKGFPGDPISYMVDDSWRDDIDDAEKPWNYAHTREGKPTGPKPVDQALNTEFLRTFGSLGPIPAARAKKFPSESLDRVVSASEGPAQFLSSDQCIMCHAGITSYYAYGPVMALETGENKVLNVSPYGEWRWSPMGLAGRDMVFHAQLESEIDILNQTLPKKEATFFANQTANTCLLCHGAMGKRQYDTNQGVGDKYWAPQANFARDWLYETYGHGDHAMYGGLARDGISCTVCHHMEPSSKSIKGFLENAITGGFQTGRPTTLYGPFSNETINPVPMGKYLGSEPRYNPYMKSSRLCGSCHTIDLPVVDYPLAQPPVTACDAKPDDELNKPDKNPNFKKFMHRIEQATYLEWLNSQFQDEFGPTPNTAKSCQQCHMPNGYRGPEGKPDIQQLKTKIAVIQDQDYPEADHLSPAEELTVRFRKKDYRRHTFQGQNVFLVEMASQFNDIFGVRLANYETLSYDAEFAIENYISQARRDTADIEISEYAVADGVLKATVTVTNKTGHRFPSGVGFRRAFIAFEVFQQNRDGRNRLIWSSGRTNGAGALVGADGKILPTEFFTGTVTKDGTKYTHQPHWETIDAESKVQIYEELSQNAGGQYTTSFIHRDCEVKDNRLLPQGWTPKGPSPEIPQAFIEATYPGHDAARDLAYQDGSGTDSVVYIVELPEGTDPASLSAKATLYYQSWAPYYLNQRFSNVPDGPEGLARRRLYYLTSNLQTRGTAIEDWKFKLVSDAYPRTMPIK